VASGRGGAAEIADFLLLQTVNRYEPVIAHLAAQPHCHPEELYRLLLEIAGDLASLTSPTRRPQRFAGYRHDALRGTFEPVIQGLRAALSVVLESKRDLNSPDAEKVRSQCGGGADHTCSTTRCSCSRPGLP